MFKGLCIVIVIPQKQANTLIYIMVLGDYHAKNMVACKKRKKGTV